MTNANDVLDGGMPRRMQRASRMIVGQFRIILVGIARFSTGQSVLVVLRRTLTLDTDGRFRVSVCLLIQSGLPLWLKPYW
ncbi:hypothetical protein IE81DRAFT_226346 [Ceraceosorus guamensis]|uniref:Uncharacterized protein n=1 Tax=Ceraceosorus guamensis TaxID=1522189 RepID=A0A316W8F3_9BASI|nr:hypothetical protein IE81DRAFT_226346 [Ceraceosorus guamensis]PWN45031.1 hypothetical protein IE81DRAFT_226346 [Ceraceosorus guamensis]